MKGSPVRIRASASPPGVVPEEGTGSTQRLRPNASPSAWHLFFPCEARVVRSLPQVDSQIPLAITGRLLGALSFASKVASSCPYWSIELGQTNPSRRETIWSQQRPEPE